MDVLIQPYRIVRPPPCFWTAVDAFHASWAAASVAGRVLLLWRVFGLNSDWQPLLFHFTTKAFFGCKFCTHARCGSAQEATCRDAAC
jgi:hypothetical protein